MQSAQLKSLVETGNYRPKPALIAEAMLRRRGVRELLGRSSRLRSAQLFVTGRLERPAPRQPDLDPRAGDHLADQGHPDSRGGAPARSRSSPSAGSAASSS